MINNVCLMGRLTAAPELKRTTNGTSVTTFCVAVDRRFQPKDGEKQTDFINCVAWRNTAEFISKYFGKGDMIAITGEIQTRKYTDKNGNNRVAVEIMTDNASFCGGKKTADNGNQTPPIVGAMPDGYEEISGDDDLPF